MIRNIVIAAFAFAAASSAWADCLGSPTAIIAQCKTAGSRMRGVCIYSDKDHPPSADQDNRRCPIGPWTACTVAAPPDVCSGKLQQYFTLDYIATQAAITQILPGVLATTGNTADDGQQPPPTNIDG